MRIVRDGEETSLNRAILEYRTAQEKVAEATQRLEEAKHMLIYYLESAHKKSHIYGQTRATVVVQERTMWDSDGLKKAVGARQYNKLTTAKLDPKKLEQALNDGAVDKVLASQYATIVASEPFVRLSEVKIKDSDD